MEPKPFQMLLRSRKFWLAVIDAFAAILALWVGALVPEQMAVLIMGTWAAIQPVFVTVIVMIGYEDKARLEAASRALAQAEPCDE